MTLRGERTSRRPVNTVAGVPTTAHQLATASSAIVRKSQARAAADNGGGDCVCSGSAGIRMGVVRLSLDKRMRRARFPTSTAFTLTLHFDLAKTGEGEKGEKTFLFSLSPVLLLGLSTRMQRDSERCCHGSRITIQFIQCRRC